MTTVVDGRRILFGEVVEDRETYVDGDNRIVYVYHNLPEGNPFKELGYSYKVLMLYPWDTNQRIIRYYAKKMGLKERGLIAFPCVLSAGLIECSKCIGLGIGRRQEHRIADHLEEPLALHLMERVVYDCRGQLEDDGYDMTSFDEAAGQLWKRADDAMRSYRECYKARLNDHLVVERKVAVRKESFE